MILAAGRGERLRPLTERIPKPMIPIGSEPLIVHQLRWLSCAGIRDVIVNVCHLADQIERGLGTGRLRRPHPLQPRRLPLETGGGASSGPSPLLRPGPLIFLNGDIWTNYPFKILLSRNPTSAHVVRFQNDI